MANICKDNDVTITIGGESNDVSANSCVPFDTYNSLYENIFDYFENNGYGAMSHTINCSTMRLSTGTHPIPNICPVTGDNHMRSNFCIIETTMCDSTVAPTPSPTASPTPFPTTPTQVTCDPNNPTNPNFDCLQKVGPGFSCIHFLGGAGWSYVCLKD